MAGHEIINGGGRFGPRPTQAIHTRLERMFEPAASSSANLTAESSSSSSTSILSQRLHSLTIAVFNHYIFYDEGQNLAADSNSLKVYAPDSTAVSSPTSLSYLASFHNRVTSTKSSKTS